MKQDKQQTVPNAIQAFARLLNTPIEDNKLDIPEAFGSGYCYGFIFNEHIRMLIFNYELKEDLVIDNTVPDVPANPILFKFQNIFTTAETGLKEAPSVLIATSSLHSQSTIPIHSNTAVINIEVDADYLNNLFYTTENTTVLQSLLKNTQPLLFEQMLYPSLQKIVTEILTEPVDKAFKLFFLRIKTEELVCRLLIELEKRNEKHLFALNTDDVQTIYKVKERILEQLGRPPLIKELAIYAGMSPSKLKSLFKQIFGNSIFSYYQGFRMQEAARLLRAGKHTVSDTGYQMGFTNLSHFSKVFEEHIGMKPKRYSKLAI